MSSSIIWLLSQLALALIKEPFLTIYLFPSPSISFCFPLSFSSSRRMEEKRFASLSLPLSSLVSGFRWCTEGRHICSLLLPTLSHPHPLWEQLDLLAFGWAVNAGTRSPCNHQCREATTSLHHYRSQRGPITTRSTGERESNRDSHPLAVPLERTLYLSLVNLYKSKGRDHTFPSEALLWVLPYTRALFPTSTLFRGATELPFYI